MNDFPKIEKMKEKKQKERIEEKSTNYRKIILIIFAILFVWFQVRPSIIRSVCFKKHLSPRRVWSGSKNGFVEIPIKDTESYNHCLHKYGLE